jgi:hypothetical protein
MYAPKELFFTCTIAEPLQYKVKVVEAFGIMCVFKGTSSRCWRVEKRSILRLQLEKPPPIDDSMKTFHGM